MRNGWLALVALVGLAGCSQAPMNVVRDVAWTIGAADLRTVQYSGSGTIYVLGQSANPDAPWPRFNLPHYTAVIDYEHSAMKEETRRKAHITPGLVRLSVGIEGTDVLLEDILQALQRRPVHKVHVKAKPKAKAAIARKA